MDQVVQKTATSSVNEEHFRKALGSAVASRALRIATAGSVGAFGLAASGLFFLSGCQSLEQAVEATRNWAHDKRRSVDRVLLSDGVRIDRDHPEVRAVANMTQEEEMEYIAKTYLPDEDWEQQQEEDPSQEKL